MMKITDSSAQPLIAKPKKKMSSLMSNQARGIMIMSRMSDIRIVSNAFIMFIFICYVANIRNSFDTTK